MNYVVDQDIKLATIFAHADRKMGGRLDAHDIRAYFLKNGISIEIVEVNDLLNFIGTRGSQYIDYSEWREFLLFHPTCDVNGVLNYLRHGFIAEYEPMPIEGDYCVVDRQQANSALQLVAGAIAGIVSRTATAPIDRLKVMRQVYGYKHKQSGFIDAYRYMLHEGGLSSLWRGNAINALKMAPETAVKYASYEQYKRVLQNSGHGCSPLATFLEDKPLISKFIAGALAGSTAQTAVYPLEVLRTRMCLRKTGQYTSIVDCARQIHSELGFRGFFRGYGINLMGIIPYAGIELATYESLKVAYTHRYIRSTLCLNHPALFNERGLYLHPPMHVVPLLAATASVLGIVATYPFALIKSKLQAYTYWSGFPDESPTSRPKLTVPILLRAIFRDDGVIGLYRGMGTNIVKVLPATAISFACYEGIRKKLDLGPLGSG